MIKLSIDPASVVAWLSFILSFAVFIRYALWRRNDKSDKILEGKADKSDLEKHRKETKENMHSMDNKIEGKVSKEVMVEIKEQLALNNELQKANNQTLVEILSRMEKRQDEQHERMNRFENKLYN